MSNERCRLDAKFERSGKIKMNEIQIIQELNLFFDIIIGNFEKSIVAMEILYACESEIDNQRRILILITSYRNILERLDGIRCLCHRRLIESSMILIRNIYEILLQLLFLLFPQEQISDKVGCFITWFCDKRIRDIRKYINEDEGLKTNKSWKNLLESRINDYETLKGVYIDKYKMRLDECNKYNNRKSWYQVYNPKVSTIYKLSQELDNMKLSPLFSYHYFSSIYQKIYNHLSVVSHGYSVLNSIHTTDDKEIFIDDIYSLKNVSLEICILLKLVETYNECVKNIYPYLKFDELDLLFLKKIYKDIYEYDKGHYEI